MSHTDGEGEKQLTIKERRRIVEQNLTEKLLRHDLQNAKQRPSPTSSHSPGDRGKSDGYRQRAQRSLAGATPTTATTVTPPTLNATRPKSVDVKVKPTQNHPGNIDYNLPVQWNVGGQIVHLRAGQILWMPESRLAQVLMTTWAELYPSGGVQNAPPSQVQLFFDHDPCFLGDVVHVYQTGQIRCNLDRRMGRYMAQKKTGNLPPWSAPSRSTVATTFSLESFHADCLYCHGPLDECFECWLYELAYWNIPHWDDILLSTIQASPSSSLPVSSLVIVEELIHQVKSCPRTALDESPNDRVSTKNDTNEPRCIFHVGGVTIETRESTLSQFPQSRLCQALTRSPLYSLGQDGKIKGDSQCLGALNKTNKDGTGSNGGSWVWDQEDPLLVRFLLECSRRGKMEWPVHHLLFVPMLCLDTVDDVLESWGVCLPPLLSPDARSQKKKKKSHQRKTCPCLQGAFQHLAKEKEKRDRHRQHDVNRGRKRKELTPGEDPGGDQQTDKDSVWEPRVKRLKSSFLEPLFCRWFEGFHLPKECYDKINWDRVYQCAQTMCFDQVPSIQVIGSFWQDSTRPGHQTGQKGGTHPSLSSSSYCSSKRGDVTMGKPAEKEPTTTGNQSLTADKIPTSSRQGSGEGEGDGGKFELYFGVTDMETSVHRPLKKQAYRLLKHLFLRPSESSTGEGEAPRISSDGFLFWKKYLNMDQEDLKRTCDQMSIYPNFTEKNLIIPVRASEQLAKVATLPLHGIYDISWRPKWTLTIRTEPVLVRIKVELVYDDVLLKKARLVRPLSCYDFVEARWGNGNGVFGLGNLPSSLRSSPVHSTAASEPGGDHSDGAVDPLHHLCQVFRDSIRKRWRIQVSSDETLPAGNRSRDPASGLSAGQKSSQRKGRGSGVDQREEEIQGRDGFLDLCPILMTMDKETSSTSWHRKTWAIPRDLLIRSRGSSLNGTANTQSPHAGGNSSISSSTRGLGETKSTNSNRISIVVPAVTSPSSHHSPETSFAGYDHSCSSSSSCSSLIKCVISHENVIVRGGLSRLLDQIQEYRGKFDWLDICVFFSEWLNFTDQAVFPCYTPSSLLTSPHLTDRESRPSGEHLSVIGSTSSYGQDTRVQVFYQSNDGATVAHNNEKYIDVQIQWVFYKASPDNEPTLSRQEDLSKIRTAPFFKWIIPQK